MYRSLAFILFTLLPFLGNTQITIDNNTLPEVGDILEYVAFDGIADTTTFRQQGEDVTWTFGNIDGSGPIITEAFNEIMGSGLDTLFPDANMVVNLDMFPAAAIRDSNSISIIGIQGNAFGGGFLDIDVEADTRFDDPYIYRQTPINYGDSYSDDFSLSFTVATDSIAFLDSIPIPIPGATLDSLRINIENSKTETATGWGMVELVGNEFEVLKIEIDETSSTGLDLGVTVFGIFTWLDASLFFDLGMLAPGGETTIHRFMSADSKASIVEFEQTIVEDSLGREITVFGSVRADLITSTRDELIEAEELVIYPQPAHDIMTIENKDQDAINSNLLIIDNSGKVMSRTSMNESRVSLEVSSYPSGTYTLLRISEKGMSVNRISVVH